MNILVIGLGSMGKRRIRLLSEMAGENNIYGVDGKSDRCKEAEKLYHIKVFDSIDAACMVQSFDCAFICTSPLSHSKLISSCLKHGWHVFTELNLVTDGYEENIKLAKEKGLVLFLSSTFLYREEISFIKHKVSNEKRWNYIYHIGQYLPDWHPWENYKDFFVGDKRTNGCREILAIELPWLINTFGRIKDYHVLFDNISNLSIDYPDNYMISLLHENGNKGSLIVDVVSPCAIRRLEAYSENQYLKWAGTPDTLFEYSGESSTLCPVILNEIAEHVDGYREFVVENAYRNEILEFFEAINTKKPLIYTFEDDFYVLGLIDHLENNI